MDGPAFARGYARAWAAIVVAGTFGLGIGLIVVGALDASSPTLEDIFRAVGSSVIASLVLYVLVSLFLDPKRQAVHAREAIGYGIQEANRQFSERFELALPTAVYEGSRIPKATFREAFVDLVASSTRYDFKGDSGKFTSYRLARCCDHREIRRLEPVRLCLLDPAADRAVEIHARQRLRAGDDARDDAAGLARQVKQIREDIYVSLWTLYGIRHRVATSVFFHVDLPFYRCEVFDRGMLLTYYLDRRAYPDYPETLHFSSSTRPYRAYGAALGMTRDFASRLVVFSEMGATADLVNTDEEMFSLLRLLGCELTGEELDALQEERFRLLDKWMAEAGLSVSELF